MTLASLQICILVEQESAALVAWRRTSEGFVSEELKGLDAILLLPEIDAALPLAELYDGVEFAPEDEI